MPRELAALRLGDELDASGGHVVAVDHVRRPFGVHPAGKIGGLGGEGDELTVRAELRERSSQLFAGAPASVRLMSLVCPVVASYKKTSPTWLSSSATMLGESDMKATKRPSSLTFAPQRWCGLADGTDRDLRDGAGGLGQGHDGGGRGCDHGCGHGRRGSGEDDGSAADLVWHGSPLIRSRHSEVDAARDRHQGTEKAQPGDGPHSLRTVGTDRRRQRARRPNTGVE